LTPTVGFTDVLLTSQHPEYPAVQRYSTHAATAWSWSTVSCRCCPTNPDGADELADVLRNWQGYIDALRESTMNWSLKLLVRASLDFSEFETD
jgi:hypothetical protein